MLLVKEIIGRSESRLQVELHDGRTPVLNRKYVYGTKEVDGGLLVMAPSWYVGKMLGLPLYEPPKAPPVAMIDELVCEAPPMVYRTEPWNHQFRAYHQSAKLRADFLNMDMGTGKSKVVLDLAASRHAAGQIHKLVVVAPVHLKDNWYNQIVLHDAYHSAAHARVLRFDERTSTTDRELLRWLHEPGYGIAICGLESLSTEKFGGRAYTAALKLVRERRCMLVVDECHKIKGGHANRTQNALSLAKWTPFRNAMTGTNITHSLGDLFHPYWMLDPRIIGYQRESEFEKHHIITEAIEGTSRRRIVMYVNVEHVAARIAPYTVQCTKAQALDLPPKTFKFRSVGLSVAQLLAYEEAKKEILGEKVDKRDQWTEYEVLRLFTALQQIVSGYWNRITYTWNKELRIRERAETFVQLVEWNENPKVKAVLEHAESCGTDQVLVWCKHRPELNDCVAGLVATYGAEQVCQLHGDVKPKQRTAELERFKQGARFMVAMLSMGEGLNGLECSHQAVYYSNSFKYGERQQTEDRQHRPGQDNKVTYTDLWTPTGIDRIIQRCLGKKEDLADWVREALAESSGEMLNEILDIPCEPKREPIMEKKSDKVDNPALMLRGRYVKMLNKAGVNFKADASTDSLRALVKKHGLKEDRVPRKRTPLDHLKASKEPSPKAPMVFSDPVTDIPPPEHYTQKRKREMPSPIAALQAGQSIQLKEKFTATVGARLRSFAKNYRKEHGLKPSEWAIKIAVDPTDIQYTRIWRIR